MQFGFSREQWQVFADALKVHGIINEVVNVVESPYGQRYVVEGGMTTPDGRHPNIRTVWIIEKGLTVPRLITAHPV